jgi:hypothetical protein
MQSTRQMHGSGNLVFVASVDKDLCQPVEDELIWQGLRYLMYNNHGKKVPPSRRVRLVHLGTPPEWQEFPFSDEVGQIASGPQRRAEMPTTQELGERPPDVDIFERDGFRCVYCGFDGRDFKGWAYLQVDHFTPRSLGGTHHSSNLVTACILCNQMKGARTWSSVDEGRKELASWWDRMRGYWEANVRPRVHGV